MDRNGLNHTLFSLEKILSGRLGEPETRDHADILSDDFREFGRSGKIWNKAEFLATLREESRREPADITEFQMQNLTDDVILVTYKSERKDRKGKKLGTNRCSIWRLDPDQQWRMVFHQATPRNDT
jgi:hypothetical protein